MIDVIMPQMGESIVEGTLTRWLKKAGERVERDEPLFEISTDKVDTEIPSPAAGVLQEVLVEEGKTVAINTVVARVSEEGGEAAAPPAAEAAAPPPSAPPEGTPAPAPAAAAPPPPAPEPQADATAEPAPASAEVAGPISPIVRKMVREFNIDLNQVRGTGAGGRVTKTDVEGYMSAQGTKTAQQAATPQAATPQAATPQAATPQAAPAQAAPAAAAPQAQAPLPRSEPAKTRVEPLSNMRQKIAEHMIFSQQTSAFVTTVHKVDITPVAKLRARQKEQFQQQYGFSQLTCRLSQELWRKRSGHSRS
ncbi:MAG: biotin/lipoyl-containing protein [Bryobacteraceae bacterium]